MAYVERSVEPLLRRLAAELPALLITGPRASGKTTTAMRHAETVVRLDQPAQAVAFRADADAALRGLTEPVLLDEWQAVPEVLGAIKRAVDTDPRPGRFLLTGSVRADLEAETWPGTGRLVRVPMFGMSIAEQLGRPDVEPLVDRLARGDIAGTPADPPDLRGYVELALRSGFPEAALGLSDDVRDRWLDSYVEQLLTRDAVQLASIRDPDRLRRYFEAYAISSAGIVDDQRLAEATALDRRTAVAYAQLLTNLMVTEAVPAWTSNRLKRLTRSPKRYVVDPALVASAVRVDVNGVLADGDLLGRVVDTFVAAQVRADLARAVSRPRLYHVRDAQGRHEVDLLVELAGRRLVGIEVKADAAPGPGAARHLAWLRDNVDDRFVAGVVLHTGPRSYELGDRLAALPICSLWS